MKIILSRKGFDDKYGGCASPIIDNELISMPIPNELISMPIPTEKSRVKLGDINYNRLNYLKILKELRPRAGFSDTYCHIDPDIRQGVNPLPQNWKAAFGQIGAAQSHLKAKSVEQGDIFLFFGTFKNTIRSKDGCLKYDGPERHIIFGYLQIGKILSCRNGTDIDEIRNNYPWHPHSDEASLNVVTNTLYIPTDKLYFPNEKTRDKLFVGLKGFGTLKYAEKRVLTAAGLTKSKWKIHDWMYNVTISRHSSNSVRKNEGYFQSVNIGQEFVISPHPSTINWARGIITD